MKKTVLLVVETPARDASAVSMIAFWLAKKYGHRPVVTTAKNELAGMIRWRPDLILLPHVRYARNKPFLEYAKAHGVSVAIHPSEGLPWEPSLIAKSAVGAPELRPYVDLLLSWGSTVADYCRTQDVIPGAEIAVTGCPRFDAYTRSFDPMFMDRTSFCEKLEVPADRKIVTWLSSTIYAHAGTTPEKFQNRTVRKSGSGEVVKGEIDFAAMMKDHRTTHVTMLDWFARHARENRDLTHIVKPHPAEPMNVYRDALGREPNVRIVDSSWLLGDLLRNVDVQVNWRCTTSMESWMVNLHNPTITVESPGLTTDILKCITEGNDVVDNFEDFGATISRYLRGAEVPEPLIEKRKEWLSGTAHFSPNKTAAESCADAVHDHLKTRPGARRSWPRFAWAAARYLRRMPRPHWLDLRRAPDHPKFLSSRSVHDWIDRLNALNGSSVGRGSYKLFV